MRASTSARGRPKRMRLVAIKRCGSGRRGRGASHDPFQRVFPRTRISKIKDTESEFVTTERGYRLATSVDGTLTGRGGDIIVVDDPLKPSDALSDSKRERVNDWFNDTLLSRLNDKQTG